MLFSVGEALRATGAEFFGTDAHRSEPIDVVVIDSRVAEAKRLFVPLKGQRTDGHLYISEALARGARSCLVERNFWNLHGATLKDYACRHNAALLIVSDPLAAMQRLAKVHLDRMSAFRIGITGSNGKTTTKEMIGAILKRHAPTAINPGNLNSEIGLPLAAFVVEPHDRFAVFEMGINRPGEMDALLSVVRPQAALVTNIGSAHIGNLGSRENIAVEKRKILTALEPGQRGYLYEKEPYRDLLGEACNGSIRFYGEESTPGFEGWEAKGLDGLALRWRGTTIRLRLPGIHNLRNALGAITLCVELGVGDEAIVDGLSGMRPLFGRSEVIEGEVTLIVDCYNANPDSMRAALEFLGSVEWAGRRIAVVGAMKELGSHSADLHRGLAEAVPNSGVDAVFLFGDELNEAARIIETDPRGLAVRFTADYDELARTLVDYVRPGDLVLLKGSRSTELERLTSVLSPKRE